MLENLGRVLLLLIGLILLIDSFGPTNTESLKITSLSTELDFESHKTTYHTYFSGGRLGGCEVGNLAYSKLQNGETVNVQSSNIFSRCIRITKADDDLVYSERFWRLKNILFGAVLLAGAIAPMRLYNLLRRNNWSQ